MKQCPTRTKNELWVCVQNMEESHTHYAEWKKYRRYTGLHSIRFHFCEVQEQAKLMDGDRSQNRGFLRTPWMKGTRTFKTLEILHILICWLYRSQRVNVPPTMHFIHFIAWMLYLNYKKEKKKNPCQALWLQWRQVKWLACKAENVYGWLLSNNEVLERRWASQVAH